MNQQEACELVGHSVIWVYVHRVAKTVLKDVETGRLSYAYARTPLVLLISSSCPGTLAAASLIARAKALNAASARW